MSGATSPEAETIIRQSAEINRLMDQSASRIDRVQRSLDAAWGAQQRFDQAQNSINSALERGRISQERANQLLDLNKQRLENATKAANGFAASNDNAVRGTRNFGSTIGQAGFQLQDFFVQVQGGTSALTALSQQGSQFLGVFGTGGAIAGAVLAIGALVAGLALGKTEADRFKEAMDRNRESFENANEAAERWRAGLKREAEQLQDLRGYYATLNRERQMYELRQANRTAAEVDERRAALLRDITRPVDDLRQGFAGQIYENEALAARNYGRGSAEFSAITSDETIQRMRDVVRLIEGFRETGDVSENAIASFSARLRELATIGGPVGQQLLRTAEEMEKLGQRSRDVERDTREVNARLAALGAQASTAATQVGALADEMGRLQRQAQQDIGQENTAAIERAQQRAQALARGLQAARNFDAQDAQREAGERYYRDQRRADEERLRSARFTDEQIRAEINRTDDARRQSANQRASLEAQNTARLRALEEAERNARRGAREGEQEARRAARLNDREARETDRMVAQLDDEAAASFRLRDALEQIAEARRRGFIEEERAEDLSRRARERSDRDLMRARQRMVEENDKSDLYAEETKRIAELTSELGNIMGDTFTSLVREGKSFSDVLDNIQERLLRLGDKYLLQPLLDQIAQLAMARLGGGGGGGLLGGLGGLVGGATAEVGGSLGGVAAGALKTATAAVLHGGGVAGIDGARRLVPAEVFLDAPRYHSGAVAGGMRFANDEVPSVLKRKELVLTEGQQAAVRREMGGRTTIINQIHTPGADSFRKSGGQVGADLARSTQRALARSA